MCAAVVETDRLALRRFTNADARSLLEMLSDEEVTHFLPLIAPRDLAEASAYIDEHFLATYRAADRGERSDEGLPLDLHYAICRKDDGAFLGYINVDADEAHDAGYALVRSAWGHGYAREALAAMIEVARHAGFPYLTATHDELNPRSGRVMAACGFTYRYSYRELWQPKNYEVVFRMYQLDFAADSPTYQGYWDKWPDHWVDGGSAGSRGWQKAGGSALQCIYIDTSGYNNYIEVLHTIRKNLKSVQKKQKDFNSLFFEFDTVYTLFYDSRSVEETDDTPLIKLLLSQVLLGLPVGSMAAAVIEDLQNGVPISVASAGVAVIAAIIDNLPGLVPEIWKKHRRTVNETRVRKQLEEIKKNLGSEYERQRYMLSSFIKAAREISDLNPMVIMLDNLQAEGDYGRLLRDYTWLTGNQGLIASLPALYVLGGRDSVEYYLEPLIRKDKLRYNEKLELKGVTFKDICLFYQKQCGLIIEDSKVVYRMLNAAAIEKDDEDDKIEGKMATLEGKSFLPIYMSMAADYYNQVKEQKEKRGVKEPVTAEELGVLDAEDQLSYFFEINLSEIKRDVFYMLSCIEVWEEKWFQLVKERFNNYLLSAVHVLRSFSSLESLDDNKVKIHDRVRESLYNSSHNQIKTDVEEWIFLYYLHMQNIYHAEGIRFAREPKVVEDLGELGVYAYVGMNYIEGIKKKEHERFTCESAMRYFQQAFSKSIILYESEERVNDQIIDILNFLANRTEKILPDSEYEVEYRRRLTLMYSYSNKFSNALKESIKLLKTCQQRVDEAPVVGRSFSNYIQVYSDRNDAYNGLGYDYGDFWRYQEAAENGFLSVQEQYRLMREAEQYIWFDQTKEREAYEYLLDICAWGQYEWNEDKLEENVAILKGTTYYKECEEGKSDGMIRRYLKARGNIPWYYLRLPEENRKKYVDFEPVRFGEQTYHLRKAFYGLDVFTLRSWHNVSVYLKGERRYEEALKVSEQVYNAAKKNLKNNKY